MPGSRRIAPRLVSAPGSYELPGAGLPEGQRDGTNRKFRPARNGIPEPRPYDLAGRRAAERAREAEVAAEIAAARAKLAGQPDEPAPAPVPPAPVPADPAPDGRCDDCGYPLASAGHRIECGDDES